MKNLLSEIRNCRVCKDHLPYAPRPIIQAGTHSKIVITGQAPGLKVQQSGVPWDDVSGDNLRDWLGVDSPTFYNESHFALLPMGLCFPGTGKTGDLPPRSECAPLWHQKVFHQISDVKLTLLIGQYAQQYYLKDQCQRTLTETVRHYEDYLPNFLPLPHPSPRNNIWQKKNAWFKEDLIPVLQEKVGFILRGTF